jgi:hypothetical protein
VLNLPLRVWLIVIVVALAFIFVFVLLVTGARASSCISISGSVHHLPKEKPRRARCGELAGLWAAPMAAPAMLVAAASAGLLPYDGGYRGSISNGMPPCGRSDTRAIGFGLWPGTRWKRKARTSAARIVTASIIAKLAPMQTRGPAPNGRWA